MILFEDDDFFDNLDTNIDTEEAEDDTEFTGSDDFSDLNNYKLKLTIRVVGIATGYRTSLDNFMGRLHKLNNLLIYALNASMFENDFSNKIVYSINPNEYIERGEWGLRHNNLSPAYLFSYDGLCFFNDEKIFTSYSEYLYDFKQIDINVYFNAASEIRRFKDFINFIIVKTYKIAKSAYPAKSINISSFELNDLRNKTKVHIGNIKMNDIFNKKNDAYTKKYLRDLLTMLYRENADIQTISNYIKAYFSTGKYSMVCLKILKDLNLRAKDITVNETDNSIYINIPKGKTAYYTSNWKNVMYTTKKKVQIEAEGTIKFEMYDVNVRNYDKILSVFGPNINRLIIEVWLDDLNSKTFDLSRFNINYLKFKEYKVYRADDVKLPKVILNPNHKPKVEYLKVGF